ncbi:MAG: hypothetical protein IJL53_11820 [Firmicutes bacterium]|nr:hypothetical protein [Bacillota bacterium]
MAVKAPSFSIFTAIRAEKSIKKPLISLFLMPIRVTAAEQMAKSAVFSADKAKIQ